MTMKSLLAITRHSLVLAALIAGLLAAPARFAWAQQPAVPALVRIVVPFSAGGSTDALARAVALQLSRDLHTNVIVDNRAGAGGLIGAAAVAKGPKDGSMLLLTTESLASASATSRTVSFDLAKDLLPVAMLGEGPMVVAVSAKSGIKTPGDLVAAAHARPNMISHGTAGVGSMSHLVAELLAQQANVQLRHVPYKGSSLALVDLASGNIDMMIAVRTTVASQVDAGRVRLVGVTSENPSPAFPRIAPMAAAAPGFDVSLWTAVFAPAGTPMDLVQSFNRVLNEVSQRSEVRSQLLFDGAAPLPLKPEEVAQRVQASYARWKSLAAAKKIMVD